MVAAWLIRSSLLLAISTAVLAFPSYQGKIPNGANVQRNGAFHPGVGHIASGGGGALNAFGRDFQASGRVWTTALCQKDSDQDGQSNGLELGDPDCVWLEGLTPQRSTDISHPGFSDSLTSASPAPATLVPTPTPTVTPSSTPNTRDPTLVPTPTPTITPSSTPTTRDPTLAPPTPTVTPSSTPTTRDPTLAPPTPTVTPSSTPTTRDPTLAPPTPTVTPSSTPTTRHPTLAPPTSTVTPSSTPTPATQAPTLASGSDVTVVVPTIAPIAAPTTSPTPAVTSTTTSTTTSTVAPSHCDALLAELRRRQAVEFPSSSGEPFDGEVSMKHKPFLHIWDQVAIVTVSPRSVTGNVTDPLHPMTDSSSPDEIHYIDTLFALDQNGAVASLHRLSPREAAPASFSFAIPQGVTALTPYEHCNKHGLFKGDEVAVTLGQLTAGAPRCSLAVCDAVTQGDCTSSDVELRRQHATAFKVSEPFIGHDLGHKPYLTISGTTATVVVGLGALPEQEGQPIHPMVASANPAMVHWVDHIWVKNQGGVVVAMRDLDATEASPAMLSFEVPEGTTQLVAYEHCNLHGLFEGDVVPVTAGQTAAGRNATCSARFCNGAAGSTTSPLEGVGSVEGVELETASDTVRPSVGVVFSAVNVAGVIAFSGAW